MVHIGHLQAVFLDRDGTIGGTGAFIHPRDFIPFPHTEQSIQILKNAGLKVFAFTNQGRISTGEATIEEFVDEFMTLGFDDAYICPHNDDSCLCRKPKPGMLLQAAKQYGLDLAQCAVVGDIGSTDMLAAHSVGAIKILVRTGWGENSFTSYRHTWAEAEPDYVADDLLQAVRWLVPSHSA